MRKKKRRRRRRGRSYGRESVNFRGSSEIPKDARHKFCIYDFASWNFGRQRQKWLSEGLINNN